MIFHEGVRSTVLGGKAAAFGDSSGTETGVVTIDEGCGVAVFVCDGEVDRIAAIVGWRAVIDDIAPLVRIEERVGPGKHFLSGNFGDRWVANNQLASANAIRMNSMMA